MSVDYDGPAFPEGDGEAQQAIAERKARLLGKVKSGTWLNTAHFKPMQWTVPGLVPEGSGFLIGPPKIGKSWWALSIGLSVASGGVALGAIPVDERDVLYLALEDGDRRMQSRCRTLLDDNPIPERFSYAISMVGENDILDLMTVWLDDHPDGLVMLDTLGRVMQAARSGQTQYERDYAMGARLKKVADDHPGSTVLTVHHSRKAASDDFMDSTSGTQGLNGAADFTIVLQRPRGENEATISISGRDVEEGSYAAVSENGSWRIVGDSLAEASHAAAQARLTSGLQQGSETDKALGIVDEHPDGITPKEVDQALDWESGHASKVLGRLYDSGRIARPRRGTYSPVGGGRCGRMGDSPSADSPKLPHLPLSQPVGDSPSALALVPDDPCPDCHLSLTGRTGSNTCSWRHTQARKESAS